MIFVHVIFVDVIGREINGNQYIRLVLFLMQWGDPMETRAKQGTFRRPTAPIYLLDDKGTNTKKCNECKFEEVLDNFCPKMPWFKSVFYRLNLAGRAQGKSWLNCPGIIRLLVFNADNLFVCILGSCYLEPVWSTEHVFPIQANTHHSTMLSRFFSHRKIFDCANER